jgi:hypothetical protein
MKKESIDVINSLRSELQNSNYLNEETQNILAALDDLLASALQSEGYKTKFDKSFCLFTQMLTNLKISSVLLSVEGSKDAKGMAVEDNNRLAQTVLDFFQKSYE